MAEEYYIRAPDSDSARGPFNLDKLVTLAEAGQLTVDTLYYDEALESWAAVGTNDDLKSQVFRQKKRLALRDKDHTEVDALNQVAVATVPEVKIEDLLAAAEGQTDETRHVKEMEVWRERAAALCLPFLCAIFFIYAGIGIYPDHPTVLGLIRLEGEAFIGLWKQPFLLLGLVDLLFATALGLAATFTFPLVRARALFGLGLFGLLAWASHLNGDPFGLYLLIATGATALAVYGLTLTLSFSAVLLFGVTGLAGALATLYFRILAPLL